jgi:hypothetical protein
MNRTESDSPQGFSARQGQYLAFIHAYTFVNGRPPAQSDIAGFFRVTPPTVHQMILTLEKAGLISRRPAAARAIAVLVDPRQIAPNAGIWSTRQNLCDEVLVAPPSIFGRTDMPATAQSNVGQDQGTDLQSLAKTDAYLILLGQTVIEEAKDAEEHAHDQRGRPNANRGPAP